MLSLTIACSIASMGPAALEAQGLLDRLRAPIARPLGVDVYWGLALASGPTIYNHGPTPTASRSRSELRAAFSPAGYATLRFTTPAVPITEHLTARLGARAFASRRRYYGRTPDPDRAASGSAIGYYHYELAPSLSARFLGGSATLQVGPLLRYTRLRSDGGFPPTSGDAAVSAAALGLPSNGGIGKVGLNAEVSAVLGSSDPTAVAGLRVSAGGTTYAPVWDLDGPLTELHADLGAFLRTPLPGTPTVHLRLGGGWLWGDTPVHERLYLGGSDVFRGASGDRLEGTAVLYGGAEVRVPLVTVSGLGQRARVGVAGVLDGGWVGNMGTPGSGLLTAYGGGIWVRPTAASSTFSAGLVHGPLGPRLYIRSDVGF
jgi:hypothetical protein